MLWSLHNTLKTHNIWIWTLVCFSFHWEHVHMFYNWKHLNEIHWAFYWSMLLIGSFNQELWLSINSWCKSSCSPPLPKTPSQVLMHESCSNAFHDGHVSSFCNSILLWCLKNTCLSLGSTFTQKIIKLFRHELSSIVRLQGFDLHVSFIIH